MLMEGRVLEYHTHMGTHVCVCVCVCVCVFRALSEDPPTSRMSAKRRGGIQGLGTAVLDQGEAVFLKDSSRQVPPAPLSSVGSGQTEFIKSQLLELFFLRNG